MLPPTADAADDGEGPARIEGGASSDIRAVVLMNMGANRNLAKLFRATSGATRRDEFGNVLSHAGGGGGIRCYVFDCHRPYHLANVHAGKDVVLFNDRPFDEEEIPSDGDNLSGDESSSSSSSSGSDSDEDDDDDEGEQEFKDDDDDDEEGEQEFEDEDEGDRRAKRQKTRDADPADEDDDVDPADDDDDGGRARDLPRQRPDGGDDLQDSDED